MSFQARREVTIQALRIPDRQRRSAKALMDRLLATDRPWIRVRGIKMNAKWIREHCAYDVTRDLPNVRCPTLAITGAKDVQVLPEHARQSAQTVAGPSDWHIIPDLTHMLRRTEEEPNIVTLIQLYKRQCKESIDGELIDIVRAWLDTHFPGTPAAS